MSRPSIHSKEVMGKLALAMPFVSSEDALKRICLLGEIRDCDPGTIIQRFGEMPLGVWVVVRGLLQLSRAMSSGRKAIYDFVFPGQSTGIIPCADGCPTPFDVVVQTPSILFHIPTDAFRRLIAEDTSLQRGVTSHLCFLARVAIVRCNSQAFLSPRALIARLLLYWGRPLLLSGLLPYELPMNLTQDDIGAIWGLSRSTVNKVLSQLSSAGLVKVNYGGLGVLDPARMRAIAAAEEPFDFFEDALYLGEIPVAINSGAGSSHRAPMRPAERPNDARECTPGGG